jgi:outer membrane immunogenic protein
MKRVLLSTVAILVAVGSASAADIRGPMSAPVKAPAYVAPLWTWTGFYVGGNIGWGWSDGDGTLTVPPAFGGPSTGRITGSGDGFLGGIQVGYNWQMGALVYGIETDFQGSGGSGNISGTLAPGALAVVATNDTEWFGTIRGRLGYAMDRWLFYVTGGGAYVENSARGTIGGVAYRDRALGWSWTVGAGVETMLANNWSVKGEYLYISSPSDAPVPPGSRLTGSTDSHILRLGVNYHF